MLKGAGGSVYAGVGIKEIWEGTARVAVSFLRISFREIIFYEKGKYIVRKCFKPDNLPCAAADIMEHCGTVPDYFLEIRAKRYYNGNGKRKGA